MKLARTTVYVLHIQPDPDDIDHADRDEWFAKITDARKRRAELLRDFDWEGHPTGEDFEIEEVVIGAFPRRDLILRLLNRHQYTGGLPKVVEPAAKPSPQLSLFR